MVTALGLFALVYGTVTVIMAAIGLMIRGMDLERGDRESGARMFFDAFIWPVALICVIHAMWLETYGKGGSKW